MSIRLNKNDLPQIDEVVCDESNADKVIYDILRNIPEDVIREVRDAPSQEEAKAHKMGLPSSMVDDKNFYDLIWKDPEYLGARFAQEKIAEWQQMRKSENHHEAEEAENKLKRIGVALARVGPRTKIPPSLVRFARDKILATLRSKKSWFTCKNNTIFIQRLEAEFDISIEQNDKIPNIKFLAKLADFITSKAFGLTPGTINDYCKSSKKIEDNVYQTKR